MENRGKLDDSSGGIFFAENSIKVTRLAVMFVYYPVEKKYVEEN